MNNSVNYGLLIAMETAEAMQHYAFEKQETPGEMETEFVSDNLTELSTHQRDNALSG